MSAQATPPVPAGWYPDPQNPATARYWDGTTWTDHRHQPGQPAPKLRAPEGTDPNTVWIWLFVLLPILGYLPLPFFPWQSYIESVMQNPTDVSGTLDAQFAIFTSPAYLTTIALSFVVYAGGVVLAWLDYRELTSRGVPKPFHWALSFIPSYGYLVYLIGRTVVVKGRTDRGLGPIWLMIGVFVLGIVLTFVVFAQMMAVMTDVMGNYDFR